MESADDHRTGTGPDIAPRTASDAHRPDRVPPCVVCGRDAVTIDRDDSAMCAKHAALFLTTDRRSSVIERGRVVR